MSLVLVAITVPNPGQSNPQRVEEAAKSKMEWQADYGQALASARAVGKPLLVVIDQSDDPAQCLSDEELLTGVDGTTLSDRFELCRVDAKTTYGQLLAKSFGATSFPFTAISSRDGMRVAVRQNGHASSEQWRSAMARAQTHTVLRPDVNAAFAPWGSEPGANVGAPAAGYCPSCRYR